MYELMQVSKHDYYMDCPSKVGFVKVCDDEVVLIDSGSDKDAAKKVKKILDAQGWKLKAIFNTHAHADHIGGNQYLQSQTNCPIYAQGVEKSFAEHPFLEPVSLYGGFAPDEMHNKFLMAKESHTEKLTDAVLPEGMEVISLPGHSYDMVGFRTRDGVVFLADSLSSEETLQKYQIGFLYDVRAYLETLEAVKTMQATCFVPSHAEPTADIAPLAQINIDKTREIAQVLTDILSEPKTFDDLLADVFERFSLTMTLPQRMLAGSTVKSYLSYLKDEGRIGIRFAQNRMMWESVQA